jgi:hypothetical protein
MADMAMLKRKKRGSLQQKDRHAILRDGTERLFSVPSFLELGASSASNGGSENNKRSSVVVFGTRRHRSGLRAANLDGLVELLTADDADSDYVETFVATHTYFVDSQSLMTRLMERFYDGEATKVLGVFKIWMNFYFQDFREENSIFFNMFLSDLSLKGFGEQAEELRAAFNAEELAYQRKLEQEEIDEQKQKAAASINADIAHRIPDLSDSTYEPAVIAHHMCLLEERLIKEISLREFLHLAWSKESAQHRARKLTQIIKRFNAVSFWVATAILTCSHSSKKRAKILSLFIQVADACLNLNNFQSAMQIYSALNFTPIEKLEKEWASLNKKVVQMHERLKNLFDPSANFKNYRETVATAEPPSIPVLSLILSDLTMVEESNTSIKIKVAKPDEDGADKGESELVHFEKMTMIYSILAQLKKCCSKSYASHEEKIHHDKSEKTLGLVKMLTDLPRLPEKELYDLKNDTKKKVKDLRKALKASQKSSKEQ